MTRIKLRSTKTCLEQYLEPKDKLKIYTNVLRTCQDHYANKKVHKGILVVDDENLVNMLNS